MADKPTKDDDFKLDTKSSKDESDTTRAPRSSDTRETAKRVINYGHDSKLPAPDKRDGIEFRYVRVNSRGQVDNINYSDALRRGWEPVKASDYPEMGQILSDERSPFPDGILIGGLILCQRDAEIGKKFREIADKESRDQIRALDRNYMRDGGHDSRVPKFNESQSSVRFGAD